MLNQRKWLDNLWVIGLLFLTSLLLWIGNALGETNLIDTDPPGPPVSLTANGSNPSPWQNTSTFTIEWTPPQDESGIKRALYKLGSVPVANFDTTGTVTGVNSLTIDATREDGQNFYIWFEDGAGNLNFNNYGVVSLRYDATTPEISKLEILNPTFPPNWYNQGAVNFSQIQITYSEKHPKTMEVNASGLQFSETREGLIGGTNQTAFFSIDIKNKPDGQYEIIFTLTDSAGNSIDDSTIIALDNTPPSGAKATSPRVSGTTSFIVSWDNTATDGDGSGISGVYDVRLQINGIWGNLRTNFRGTSLVFEGVHGQTYGFEVAAHDNVGNVEPFLGIPETVTTVDTNLTETIAPGPPNNLNVEGQNPSPWQNSPRFLVAWEPPEDPSGIARTLYKLGEPPTANYDTTGSTSSINSVNIEVTQEDGQNLYLWFVDGRGNVDFHNYGVINLRYDNTAPHINRIAFVNPAFAENWYNPNTVSAAEVEITYTEKHPMNVRVTSSDSGLQAQRSDLPAGNSISSQINIDIQGIPDGQHRLVFTVTDSAGNSASDTSTIAIDGTPPVETRAVSPDTSLELSFIVQWDKSGNDGNGSGLSGLYDVHVQVNGGVWETWLRNFNGTSAEFQGEQGNLYGFEAAAHDNVGNVEVFKEVPETTTLVDTTFDVRPPTIAHTPPSFVEEGNPVTIQAQIRDNKQVAEVLLFYKPGGQREFTSKPMSSAGNGVYAATLGISEISNTGINYYIRAFDGVNFSYDPAQDWEEKPHNIAVRIIGENNQGLAKASPQPAGNLQTAFRMISVPLNAERPGASDILEDDLGTYDPKKWRLFQFNPTTNNYREFPNIDLMTPGKAFWLIVRDQNKRLDSGVGKTVATNQPFQLTLRKGWNDIGIPFNFSVQWNEVQVIKGDKDSVIGPYTYRGEWLLPDQVSILEPWEGYSIYSNEDNVIISIPPFAFTSTIPSTVTQKLNSEVEWFINIQAICQQARDGFNRLGVAQQARTHWDRYDYLEPPPVGEYVSVRFPHEDWQQFNGFFATDFRPIFKDGMIWDFQVETNIKNAEVSLIFENLESLPEKYEVVFLDLQTLQQINLRKTPKYTFLPDQQTLMRNFQLVTGTSYFIDKSDVVQKSIPRNFALHQNYPNPFNASTVISYEIPRQSLVTITVFNILGQKIRLLLSQVQKPGFYRVTWDGKSDQGQDMSTGVYLIQLNAQNFRFTRKAVLIR